MGDDYCLTLKKSAFGNTLMLWGAGEHHETMSHHNEGVYRFLLNKQTGNVLQYHCPTWDCTTYTASKENG